MWLIYDVYKVTARFIFTKQFLVYFDTKFDSNFSLNTPFIELTKTINNFVLIVALLQPSFYLKIFDVGMNILNAKRLFIAIILDRVGYFAYYEPTKKLCINEYHYVFASFFSFLSFFLAQS